MRNKELNLEKMRLEIERMEAETNKRRQLLLMGDEEEDDILA